VVALRPLRARGLHTGEGVPIQAIVVWRDRDVHVWCGRHALVPRVCGWIVRVLQQRI